MPSPSLQEQNGERFAANMLSEKDGEDFKISQYHPVARKQRPLRDDSDDQKISLEKLERSLEVLHRRHQESLTMLADLLVSLPDLSAVTAEVSSVPGGLGGETTCATTFENAEVATGTGNLDPTSSMTVEVACPVQEEVSEVKTPFDAVQKMVHSSSMVLLRQFDLDTSQHPDRWTAGEAASNMDKVKLFASRLIVHRQFEFCLGILILVHTVCIGFDLQSTLDGSDSPVLITVAENVFLLVYTIEWSLRVLSMGWCTYYTDPWCLLDFTLLVCGAIGGVVVPVLRSTGQDMVSLGWLQSILVIRALRLLRLVRALRALTYFRTVWRLVHGLLTSWNAMLSTLALITLTLYTSACIAIEIVTKDVELNSNPITAPIVQANFSSLGTTFLTLTQFVALDSAAAVYKPLVEAKPILIFYFGSIVLFVSIALMPVGFYDYAVARDQPIVGIWRMAGDGRSARLSNVGRERKCCWRARDRRASLFIYRTAGHSADGDYQAAASSRRR
ncbi:Scn5a [Symbiodinium sp. KB8]|nr:Scn5a [Symbiodinium sp. KB8]